MDTRVFLLKIGNKRKLKSDFCSLSSQYKIRYFSFKGTKIYIAHNKIIFDKAVKILKLIDTTIFSSAFYECLLTQKLLLAVQDYK